MLFEAIIDPISDISIIAAQSAVEYIADRSSLQRIGGVLLIGGIIWLVFKLLFS
jgi:pantothenate kinase